MIPAQSAERFAAMQLQLERRFRPPRAADDPIESRLERARRDYVRALGDSPLRMKYPSLNLFLHAVETAILSGNGNEFTSCY